MNLRYPVAFAVACVPLAAASGLAPGCSSAADLGGSGGSGASAAAGGGAIPGDGGPMDAPTVGQLDGSPDTSLPLLPELTNVVATEREDSVGIDFDPVEGAVDYRVYPLPADADVTKNADGSLTIKNAIYRCAGLRQTNDLPTNLNSVNNGNGVVPNDPTLSFAGQFTWGATILPNPTLGYVYVTPAADRVPVYAIGVDPSGSEHGWAESRPKIYTTDAGLRQSLLAKSGRDDGIVFYVPMTAGPGTQTIYHSEDAQVVAGQGWTSTTYSYFGAADMAAHAMDSTPPAPVFQVLAATAPGAQPLMAVNYAPAQLHTELAVGKERYKRAANQGQGPLWHLEWSGLTQPTTLVVEALASGCPFQGFLSPQSLNAPPHQRFFTLAELQAASPSGEVFINGQYDLPGTVMGGLAMMQTPNASPIPIARSFVQVAPQPHNPADWDWYEGFPVGSSFGTATPSSDPGFDNDQWSVHYTTPTFDFGAYSMDKPSGTLVLTYGQFLGQLWAAFDDTGQDVTGRLRFTALQKANIDTDATKFLHVTWTVNIVSTDRRYPQLIVSDQPAPVEDGFKNPSGNFLLIQPFLGPSMRLEVEAFHGLVNGMPWAVNNQAPEHRFVDYDNWNDGNNTNATLPPAAPPFEHAGVDRQTRFDAYISSGRVYLFLDGAPAGCTLMPANGFALTGPVTVTFGDVLYHEGAPDEEVCAVVRPYAFLHEHECTETKRHWDDLGFKSGVPAPSWDYQVFPCVAY